MSEKIEINTITKHENKYKNCRFEMIDVEDPLWEYGYPLKRVLIDNQTGETYDEVGKLVGLLNSLNDELEESSAFIIEQREENKQLKEQVQILKKEVRDFLHLCDVCDIQSHLSDECEEVLNDE